MKSIFGCIILVLSCAACAQEQDSIASLQDTNEIVYEAVYDNQVRQIVPDPDYTLIDLVRTNGYSKSNLTIFIDKSVYLLQVRHKDSVLITYPCVLGFNPTDDKHQEGDGCTPEGTFKIRSRYAHGSWSYFIWVDYPNDESWRRFKARKADGTLDASATIGGEIGIHGVPEGMDDLIDNGTNWTLGCISLKTAHITDLYKSIGSSTMIEIVK